MTRSNSKRSLELRRDYERLVRTGAGPAWRSARRFSVDDEAASDAVQEAFLRVLEGRVELARVAASGDEVEGLRVLAVRAALDRRRNDVRRHMREQRRAMDTSEVGAVATDELSGKAEEHHALRRALNDLPEDLRTPLVLRFEEELSFNAIGGLLGLSESGAHDRVGRALAKLRGVLIGAGVTTAIGQGASSSSALEVQVRAALASAPRHAPPADLASRLLGLQAGLTKLIAGGALVAGLLISAVALTSVALSGHAEEERAAQPAAVSAQSQGEEQRDADSELRGAGEDAPSSREALAPPATPVPASAATPSADSTVHGRVVDPHGALVPGATVRLVTHERDGKFALWSASARSDSGGRFRIPIPFDGVLAGREAARLKIDAGHLGYMTVSEQFVVAKPETHVDAGDVLLAAPAGDREGDYTLDLLVRDELGAPVAGALIDLTHVVARERARVGPEIAFPNWSTSEQWLHLDEASGRTGPDGRVSLAGARLGSKSIWIEPAANLAPVRVPLALLREGQHLHEVSLVRGATLRGRLRWADGAALSAEEAGSMQINAVLELNRWRAAQIDADGRFELAGLALHAHEVRVNQNWGWPANAGIAPSPAILQLTPGAAEHELILKRKDDARDIGVHDAELHGVVVSARTGEPLPLRLDELEAWRLRDVPANGAALDLRANLFEEPVAQRMLMPEVPRVTNAFHRVGLPPGDYMLRVGLPEHGLAVIGPLALGAQEVRSGLELRVAPPAAAHVTLTDEKGAPLAGAWVFITGIGEYSDTRVANIDEGYRKLEGSGSYSANGGQRSNAEGVAQLSYLPHDLEGVVAVVHPDYAAVRSPKFSLSAGATLPVKLQMTRRR